jgi:hypothetical protein
MNFIRKKNICRKEELLTASKLFKNIVIGNCFDVLVRIHCLKRNTPSR